ncbi:histidine phosphatase family protein [Brevibacillus ruminantium]|uniref:Histidine phosphatase family protein n=1 Tax=Brevibacillus ruminantium TaxID=2950604 RepID=A0ABY4WKB1_9BACL|nr:histidine phosphatase family protein [Brevibacillus ruminantium]USG67201.1 histidine phosphatase family protein [Brevibacillus ruminantium]
MHTVIYLIRHGETDWNLARRIQGHSDIELNQEGVSQAQKVAARFQGEPISAVYASDLIRAKKTAECIAEAIGSDTVFTLPTLRERCYGDWEGLTYEEIRARFKDMDETACGIETMGEMQKRASEALTEIAVKHAGQSVVVVSHGGLINSFLLDVTKGEQGTGITRIDNTGINRLHYTEEQWEVVAINDTAHLEG